MALYTANVASAIQIGIYHVPVTTLNYSAATLCDQGPPFNLLVGNTASAEVVLAYPFPTSGCSGLGCFPNVTLAHNGTNLGAGSWSFDPNRGFVISFGEVPLSGQLVLSMSHSQGVTTIDPAAGHVARINVNTMC
jgi:hypothetical protein